MAIVKAPPFTIDDLIERIGEVWDQLDDEKAKIGSRESPRLRFLAKKLHALSLELKLKLERN
jgi:hypothetical protein